MANFLTTIGDFAFFSADVLRRVFSCRYTWRSLVDQMYRVGVESLTVVNLCAFFIGLVMVLQSTFLLARFGAKEQVATIVTLSFVREIGPVFTAIMFSGRVGTGIAAELGSMVVTEQIDAYRAFGSDPVARLATPRVLATTLMLPALTAIANLVGVFSGFLLSVLQSRIFGHLYIKNSILALDGLDVVSSLGKAVTFGLIIGLISTYKGFRTRKATEAVGESTTETMVACVLAVLVSDFFLTKFFLTLGNWIAEAG